MRISHHKLVIIMSDIKTKNTNIKHSRNSSVEILRIFAMLMVIMSHVYASKSGEEYTGILQVLFVFIISAFHSGLGVIVFMLISGYYSVKYSTKKLTSYIATCFTCSMVALLINVTVFPHIGYEVDKKMILCHFIPISSRSYWYISCYFALLVLSPFINKLINTLSKREFTYLVLVLITIFYLLPTFLYFNIMGDSGKGIVTMISTYIIGAYLSKYKPHLSSKALWLLLIGSVFITFAGNMAATIFRGETSYPFSRECTVTTLLTGILLLLIANKSYFCNKAINLFSTKTLYVYIISCTVTGCIGRTDLLDGYKDSVLIIPICLGISLGIYIAIYILSIPLQYIAGLISKIMQLFIEKAKKILIKSKRAGRIYESFNR